jgi:predicted transcriptional regulator
MSTRRWEDIKRRRYTPEEIAQIKEEAHAEVVRLTLRELREAAGKTQADLAPLTEMTQSELSKVERRADHRLSTLRRYVEALGGELEIAAVIGNQRIVLNGV